MYSTATKPAIATREWTAEELGFLLGNAGRVPADDLCLAMGRPRETLEAVAARVRACGYPISLTTEICPRCGRRAPIVWSVGICKPCQYRERHDNTQRQISEILPHLNKMDRAIYEDTEAELGTRVSEPMPTPPSLPDGADEVERMRVEDAYCAELSEWEARRLHRELKAAQKRKERILRKAKANGYEPPQQRKPKRDTNRRRGPTLPIPAGYITPREYAAQKGLSVGHIQNELARGRIRGMKVGWRWAIPADALCPTA